MTRKHYLLIAQAMKEEKPDSNIACAVQWVNDLEALCRALRSDNPAFNADRFLAACGIERRV
jgi:hypothetical protein